MSPTEPIPILRKLPYLLSGTERALVRHAISLHHGISGVVSNDDPEADAAALVAIVDEWARDKRAELNGGPK